jgi:hypothetical protein
MRSNNNSLRFGAGIFNAVVLNPENKAVYLSNSTNLTSATTLNQSKKRSNYLPHAHIYQKKQHIVKTLAATLNKSKKRKRIFLFF